MLDHKEQPIITTQSDTELMAEMLQDLMQSIKDSRQTVHRIRKNKICKSPKLTIIKSKINT